MAAKKSGSLGCLAAPGDGGGKGGGDITEGPTHVSGEGIVVGDSVEVSIEVIDGQ